MPIISSIRPDCMRNHGPAAHRSVALSQAAESATDFAIQMIPHPIVNTVGFGAGGYPNMPMPIKVIQPTMKPIAKSR